MSSEAPNRRTVLCSALSAGSARPCADAARGLRSTRQRRAASAGFTLIELLIVMSIAGILVVGAVRTANPLINGYRLQAEATAFMRALQFARSESAKRGAAVSLCPSTDGSTCVSSTTGWASGWIVFYDANANGTVSTILRAELQNPAGVTSTTSPSPGSSLVTYNRQGALAGLSTTLTFSFHEPSGAANLVRCIALLPSGRSVLQTAGTGSCS